MMSRFAHGFRMKVIAHDPFKKDFDEWITPVDFDTLFQESDVVTVHVHLTDETVGLVSRRAIGLMKPTAYLVNTSRGAVVDEEALIDALDEGRIAGAGVDVITGELEGNLHDHPLVAYARGHDNLLITPHMGGVTHDSQAKAYGHTLEKIARWLEEHERPIK